MSRSTLTGWRTGKYAARYQRIHEQLMARIRERQAQQAEELSDRHAESGAGGGGAVHQKAHGLSTKDGSLAARNFATARGISTDKARLLRNEPTQITENRNVGEILRKLTATNVIDGTAVELHTRPVSGARRP